MRILRLWDVDSLNFGLRESLMVLHPLILILRRVRLLFWKPEASTKNFLVLTKRRLYISTLFLIPLSPLRRVIRLLLLMHGLPGSSILMCQSI